MENAIVVKNITKKYKLYGSVKERILDLISPRGAGEDFYALENVDFMANKSEVVGFVGINGSGKSTLSNIIAGIVPETSGEVETNGQVSLIAVAAGLKNDLTGRDNIELKLLMLGFNKREIKVLEPDIIDFSELGKFIDQPVKSYSSGMKSRLGFSISVSVNPDILIIDEALSVGDKAFAEKSLNKMKEFKRAGKTMVFVSHSIGQMKQFCDKILWLEFGRVKGYGTAEEILPKYEDFLKRWQIMSREERKAYRDAVENKENILLSDKENSPGLIVDNFYDTEQVKECIESPISVLAHIRSGDSFVFSSLDDLTKGELSIEYQQSVYFAKKKAECSGQLFYLLSTKPSAVDGVLGWMRVNDLAVHRHVIVDTDTKEYKLNGTGKGFNMPWGGPKNCLYEDLSSFKGMNFKVIKTDFVGDNIWYRGVISEENQEVWMHGNSLNIR